MYLDVMQNTYIKICRRNATNVNLRVQLQIIFSPMYEYLQLPKEDDTLIPRSGKCHGDNLL